MNQLSSHRISKDKFFEMVSHDLFENNDVEISFDHKEAYKWLDKQRADEAHGFDQYDFAIEEITNDVSSCHFSIRY